jgi:phosphohistidine swiveling domain-containing protein
MDEETPKSPTPTTGLDRPLEATGLEGPSETTRLDGPSERTDFAPPPQYTGTNFGALEPALRDLESQFTLVMGRPERVVEACRILSVQLEAADDPDLADRCHARVVTQLHVRQGGVAQALIPFLEERARRGPNPRRIILSLLVARDDVARRHGLRLACEMIESGRIAADVAAIRGLAFAIEEDEAAGRDVALLERVRDALRGINLAPTSGELVDHGPVARGAEPLSPASAGLHDRLEALLLQAPDPRVRFLAARLLDLPGTPVPADRLARLFGAETAAVLAPYLAFTRATHRNMVELTPESRVSPALLSSMQDAERALGRPLLGEVLGELGWDRLAWGISCRRLVGLSLDGGFPLAVTPAEAMLLDSCGPARRTWDRFLVVAHGGSASGENDNDMEATAVQRFRKYNILHAELLGEILEVAPLTPAKVRRIVERMEQVVSHFAVLFREHSEDATRVEACFAALRDRAIRLMAEAPDDQPLQAEVARVVQMFEDPRSLDDVRTLHGLKRYLHQQGLRLAFRAFRSGRATNRTVDVAIANASRVLQVVRRIRYIDFEPDPGAEPGDLPYPVALIAEVLGRRLVHGKIESPDFEILAYGNEIQIFIGFRNHPVFLRLDLSPPQRGGMIDLEYYGVSQYELDRHPDLSLQWVQRVFRRLDFDVRVEQFRLHIRYDKERALDLGDLLAHVRILGYLLPHLMDLDWVIAVLDYPETAKAQVADAWADLIPDWGWLPIAELLTADRRHILRGIAADPAGEREVRWDGHGEYRDRFIGVPDRAVWGRIRAQLEAGGLARFVPWPELTELPVAQIPLEKFLFTPLREAVHLGGLRETHAGPMPTAPDGTPSPHEAEALAQILLRGGAPLDEAARIATVVGSIERHLRFVTSGSIQGYPVQRATLVLRGERVELSVLRDADGIARLALADDCPMQSWTGTRGRSHLGVGPRLDCRELIRRLRRDNYVAVAYESPIEQDGRRAALTAVFAAPNALAPPGHSPGDLVIEGIVASSGRAAGFARLGTEGRSLDELDGAILFAPAFRPDDTPLLRRSAAIVSTGGGILSHAGLIALELHKPALVISGRWRKDPTDGGTASFEGTPDGSSALAYRHFDFREDERAIGPYAVLLRRDLHEREQILREGDLVVVDAEVGTLTVLGQDRDALALQRELRQIDTVAGELGREEAGPRLLLLRGRWHRAVHQLKKLLSRIDRPALARHAARELLFARSAPSSMPGRDDVGGLLHALFANAAVGEAARLAARRQHVELARRHGAYVREALRIIPITDSVPEILHLRLGVIQVRRRLDALARLLNSVGMATAYAGQHPDLDFCARRRLDELREQLRRELASTSDKEGTSDAASATNDGGPSWIRRHRLERLESLERVLPGADDTAVTSAESAIPRESAASYEGAAGADGLRDRQTDRPERARSLAAQRRDLARRLPGRLILDSRDGGRELAPLIGSKGANLGEIARILGPDRVPPWFATTDAAFQELMAGPPGRAAAAVGIDAACPSLAAAIDEILGRPDSRAARKAAAIRQLWEGVPLSPRLEAEIDAAYHALGEGCFVAIRSSAFEEDTEGSSWAGQFDTFLFIQSEEAVRDHVKLAMASLWTERALVHREEDGDVTTRRGDGDVVSSEEAGDPTMGRGGGVIVQRIVDARVAGVLHTLSATAGQAREMVINVGLGLGEGVVSGTVEVDHIVVSRETSLEEDPLRVHYLVGDKSSRIVFDRLAGSGTRREETLYHQRLRAALEYSDLGDLVRAAASLERVYGFPLDIEFAFEEDSLYILQVRPIVAFQNALRATLEQAPLTPVVAHGGKD